MTPLLPKWTDDIQALAQEVIPITSHTVRELLRIINSYYSNLIEGHNTHPPTVQQQYDDRCA